MDPEVQHEIQDLLYREAYLLDQRKYREWLNLLTDDIVYRMPVRVTVEDKDGPNLSSEMSYFDETKKSLTTRVERLYTAHAWVERPAPRQRRFISNIMIEPGSGDDEYRVRSYFLYKRSRASDVDIEELFGEREDVVRKVDGEWKIAARTVYPDQAVITTMNLSMFL